MYVRVSHYLALVGWKANPKKAIIAPIKSPARPVTSAAKLASGLLVRPAKTTYISPKAAMKITMPVRATAIFKFDLSRQNSLV